MAKYNWHALVFLFYAKRFTIEQGMNALQDGPLLLISDNCVTPEDVAACDVAAILKLAKCEFYQRSNYKNNPA